MKIGILTLHSQLNYGGLLQAYALQEFFKLSSDKVFIIDYWISSTQISNLLGRRKLSFIGKTKRLIHKFLKTGAGVLYQRGDVTKKFFDNYYDLTPFHFSRWSEISSDALTDFDCLVVGSDQIWHTPYSVSDNKLDVYLLEDAPRIPAVAYAASFGVSEIPQELEEKYVTGWRKFKAISVREKEGKEILAKYGFHSTHVVDPTLLVPMECWEKLCGNKDVTKSGRRLFCYFMEDKIQDVLPQLVKFVEKTNGEVDVFFNNGNVQINPTGISSFLKMIALKLKLFWYRKKIHFHLNAGPEEFVQCAGQATDAVSDSFHALMFSIIFNLNVRILRPIKEKRLKMFSRIEEFADYTISGKLIADDLTSALKSIAEDEPVVFDQDKIEERRKFSQEWLLSELNKIAKEKSVI